MTDSFSNLVNNLPELIHNIECTYGNDDTNVKLMESHAKYVPVVLNTQILRMI